MRRQYDNKGLTIVSDEVFDFFKVLYCKLKSVQTFKNLERNTKHLLSVTELQLKNDVQVLHLWCNLFMQSKNQCNCSTDYLEKMDEYDNEHELNLDFEIEQCLILDMLEHVLHYFCSAHLSDIMSQYKDNVLHKEKSISIRHKLLSGVKKSELTKSQVSMWKMQKRMHRS